MPEQADMTPREHKDTEDWFVDRVEGLDAPLTFIVFKRVRSAYCAWERSELVYVKRGVLLQNVGDHTNTAGKEAYFKFRKGPVTPESTHTFECRIETIVREFARSFLQWSRGSRGKVIAPLEKILGIECGATPGARDFIGRQVAAAGAAQERCVEAVAERTGKTRRH